MREWIILDRTLAGKIDARVLELEARGCDDQGIFVEMADYMPEFKRLARMAGKLGMNELRGRFPGLHRYATILEGVARDSRPGKLKAGGSR